MPLALSSRNIVVAGEFNRAIIQPKWLIDRKIFPAGPIEMLVSDRPDMPRVFNFGGYHWEVGINRLMVRSVDAADADPGVVVSEILRILPHTPVSAVGHNFLFCSDQRIPNLEPCLGGRNSRSFVPRLGDAINETDLVFVVRTSEQTRLTVKVIDEPMSTKIDLNFHIDTPELPELQARLEARLAATGQGTELRRRADEVISVIEEDA